MPGRGRLLLIPRSAATERPHWHAAPGARGNSGRVQLGDAGLGPWGK
jgi:hypothetical protein